MFLFLNLAKMYLFVSPSYLFLYIHTHREKTNQIISQRPKHVTDYLPSWIFCVGSCTSPTKRTGTGTVISQPRDSHECQEPPQPWTCSWTWPQQGRSREGRLRAGPLQMKPGQGETTQGEAGGEWEGGWDRMASRPVLSLVSTRKSGESSSSHPLFAFFL